MIRIDRFDHIVLTVGSIEHTCSFYARVLGMTMETFGAGRTSLHFGNQKINLHPAGNDLEPKARTPFPGSADLCLIANTPLEEVIAHLKTMGVPIELGPVTRVGATGEIESVYIRDPDGNLIEISNYVEAGDGLINV
jgi:catechol 2,3-dioxygenase-like lactoylglutathione lyase family enzyme